MLQSLRLPLSLSLVLHGLLGFFVLFHGVSDSKQFVVAKNKSSPKIVDAVSVSEKQVTEEINRIKTEKLKQQQARLQQQRKLEQQAQKAKEQRIAEEKRLAKIKRQAKRAERKRRQQQLAEKRRLAKIKKAQQQEKRRLAKLKKEQDELNKKRELERKKQQQIAAEKKRQQLAMEKQQRLAKQQKINGLVNKYKALIVNSIGQNWILPENVDKSASCQFEIKIAPGGTVLNVKLTRSSGSPILDRSAQTAIYKASPLPVPSDPDAFTIFRLVRLTVRPENSINNS